MEENTTTHKQVQTVGRVGEIVLSIIGGIFGIIGALFAIGFGGVQKAVDSSGKGNVSGQGWAALLFATIAIVAIFFISSKPKRAGWMLIISAVGGLIAISFFYILPFILLLIAGIMCLTRGRKKTASTT